MRAEGHAGLVPPQHSLKIGGLQIAVVARTASIYKVRAPRFGHMSVLNKSSDKQPTRGKCIVLALLHVPARPDIVMVIFVWVVDKADLSKFYPMNLISAADPGVSKKNFKAMKEHEHTIVVTWSQPGAFALFEPSIKVLRDGDDDPAWVGRP